MATPITAIVDPVTNQFCDDGMAPGRIVVSVPDTPTPRLQRYSGDSANPFRDATQQEIAAYDASKVAARVAAIMTPEQTAFMQWVLTRLLGRTPAAQELSTARAELGAIYKSIAKF
jgi:hypothetical protein